MFKHQFRIFEYDVQCLVKYEYLQDIDYSSSPELVHKFSEKSLQWRVEPFNKNHAPKTLFELDIEIRPSMSCKIRP